MEQETNLEQIEAQRQAIDQIDCQIVDLLNERARHSLAIRELKGTCGLSVYSPKREEEIREKLSAYNKGPLYNDHIHEIYDAILKVMKEVPRA